MRRQRGSGPPKHRSAALPAKAFFHVGHAPKDQRRAAISNCRRNTADSLGNNKSERPLCDKVVVARTNTSKTKVITRQSQVSTGAAIKQF
ncbi:MAG: hypothetical protein DME69_04655 [Verrucomicrobia bacterium]|nr:MAG: hypothetical protein DME69_04655 [Verrucomicrobiota bacterium]PYL77210.1 MAG: hypothetical protein DMF26_04765 [Verrucomicrobiota bacterium]